MLRTARWTTVTASRSVKTLHTPIYNGSELTTRQNLLSHIGLLEKILISASYDRSMLYSGKYKKLPQVISGNDSVNVNFVLKEFLTSLQLAEAENLNIQRDPSVKLGKIGLQLFMDCHQGNVTAFGALLSRALLESYNKCPTREMVFELETALKKVQTFLRENRVVSQEPRDIDRLVHKMCTHEKNAASIIRVLRELDYNLVSDDVVRVARGKRTQDDIEVSKGWKFATGVIDTNDAYLRSLQVHKNKLVSISSPMLVLVHDGHLREANNILPALHYATKQKKNLVLVVNGDCKGDALAAITIHNNKNRRQNVDSQVVVLKYSSRRGKVLQEDLDFITFLKLPHGMGSIYSPTISEFVPSSASASQFFGTLESLKATTGEAFLYNSGIDIQNDASRTTVTLHVGGQSEFEIDHRRAELDHVINNVLCHGLSQGWVPSQGVSLAKCVKVLESSSDAHHLGNQALIENLTAPLENALRNSYGAQKYQASRLVTETINDLQFTNAYLPDKTSTIEHGILEPWNKLDQTLSGVTSFIKLVASCEILVTRFFDKPRKD
ncbi:LADA_0B07250g1_1 [Lachancea dasiensis]|uniref:LADA_0B07250g1_1 n=1 Tax=Lachancea dasiensis TaxID=1072105 RepID=A0A1G4ITV0_9SACH|nr:LADA_0B07250g1_1 [Lachancea dasiensis]